MRLGMTASMFVRAAVVTTALSSVPALGAEHEEFVTLLANTINSAATRGHEGDLDRHVLQKAWDLMLVYRIRYQEWPDRVDAVEGALLTLRDSGARCEIENDPWAYGLCGLLLGSWKHTLHAAEQLMGAPRAGFCGNAMAAEDFAFHELVAWADLRAGEYQSAFEAVAAAAKNQGRADIDVGSQRWALLWGLASLANEALGKHTEAIDFARRARRACSESRHSWNLYYESDPQVEREVCAALEQLSKILAEQRSGST